MVWDRGAHGCATGEPERALVHGVRGRGVAVVIAGAHEPDLLPAVAVVRAKRGVATVPEIANLAVGWAPHVVQRDRPAAPNLDTTIAK